jgi:hypothetical protein
MTFTSTIATSAVGFSAMEADYIEGVATALRHPKEDIRIVSVVEVGFRRRLLTPSVKVETRVSVQADEVVVLSQYVTMEKLNTALAANGIRVEKVTPVVISTAIDMTTPPPNDKDGGQIMTIIWIASGSTAAVLLFSAVLYLDIVKPLRALHSRQVSKVTNTNSSSAVVAVFKVEKFYNYGREGVC